MVVEDPEIFRRRDGICRFYLDLRKIYREGDNGTHPKESTISSLKRVSIVRSRQSYQLTLTEIWQPRLLEI